MVGRLARSFAFIAILLMISGTATAQCLSPGCGPLFAPMPISPCACVIAPVAYACPTPAPPSPGPTTLGTLGTNEPPIGKKPFGPPPPPPSTGMPQRPIIDQYRTFGGVPQITESRTPNCKVSFWNLTNFDVNLTVGDKTVLLPKDRAVVMELNRSFTWRINTEAVRNEDVPDDRNHFEVLVK